MSAHTTRRLLLPLLAAALLLPAAAASGATGRTLDWGLSGCRAVIALVPVEPSAVQPHVPEGFTATVPDSVAAVLPPDPRLDAVLGIEALDCAEGIGLHGAVADLDYGSFFTFVEPPAHLAAPEHDLHFVKWDVLVPDAPRRDVLRRHGVAARDGGTDLTTWLSGAGGTAFDVGLTFEGGEGYRLRGVAGAPTPFTGSFIEHSATSTGLATWTTSYDAASAVGGTGTVQLAAAGFPARVVGRTLADAYFLVPTGLDFTDGAIVLPPPGPPAG